MAWNAASSRSAVATARWVTCEDPKRLDEFTNRLAPNLAIDHAQALVYLAPSRVNLDLTQERWPQIQFHATRTRRWDSSSASRPERSCTKRFLLRILIPQCSAS